MEEAVRVDNLKNLAAFHTLDEDLDIPVGKLKTLDYVDDGADLIDLIRLGLIYAGVVLRSEKDFSIAGKRLFQSADTRFASDNERRHHMREDDDVPDRHHG